MKPEQPRFQFEDPDTSKKEDSSFAAASEGAEQFSDNEANLTPAEDDDPREGDPWHEKTKRREAYRQKASRGPLSEEPVQSADEFSKSLDLAKKKLNELTGIRKKRFDRFYRSMSYDQRTEYMHKSKEDRERIFKDWIEKNK